MAGKTGLQATDHVTPCSRDVGEMRMRVRAALVKLGLITVYKNPAFTMQVLESRILNSRTHFSVG